MHLSRPSISIVVILVVVLWALYLVLFNGVVLDWSHAKPFSLVVTSLVVIGFWFEHQLWRKRPFKRFVNLPDLRGTWQAELQSDFIRPGESEPVPPIRCYFPIAQSYSNLSLGLLTPESSSTLIAHNIRPSEIGDGHQIVGVYRNEPKVEVREQSAIHRGALILNTHGPKENPTSLTGEYWTDRGNRGSLKLERRVDEIYSRFQDAEAAFRSESTE